MSAKTYEDYENDINDIKNANPGWKTSKHVLEYITELTRMQGLIIEANKCNQNKHLQQN